MTPTIGAGTIKTKTTRLVFSRDGETATRGRWTQRTMGLPRRNGRRFYFDRLDCRRRRRRRQHSDTQLPPYRSNVHKTDDRRRDCMCTCYQIMLLKESLFLYFVWDGPIRRNSHCSPGEGSPPSRCTPRRDGYVSIERDGTDLGILLTFTTAVACRCWFRLI